MHGARGTANMRTPIVHVLMCVALAAACTGSAQVHGSATYTAPELVYVSPGVQVVADWDEPVFYTDNYYWRYHSGVWYRSQYHTRGWVRVQTVPVAVRQIDRPTAYIRYRGEGHVGARD